MHPFHENGGGQGQRRAKAMCRAEGGNVQQFPISLRDADRNRLKFENAVHTVAGRHGMDPADLRAQMGKEYSAPVLRMPGVPEKRGGRVR